MIKSVYRYCLASLILLGMTVTSYAQPRDSVEGIHYQPLETLVPTETDPDKIEVREIFWYGCPECSTLEPLMTDWRDGVTGDLVFFRTPAVWNDIMALHARIFYTADAVGAQDRIHRAAFNAIHQDSNPLRTEAQIRELFTGNGVDAQTFTSVWNSEEVAERVRQAQVRTGDYGIERLPSIIVNGQYRVTQNQAVSNHIELNIAVNLVIRELRDIRRID